MLTCIIVVVFTNYVTHERMNYENKKPLGNE